jgi:hypothetical protein
MPQRLTVGQLDAMAVSQLLPRAYKPRAPTSPARVSLKKPAGVDNLASGAMLNPPIIARGSSDGR